MLVECVSLLLSALPKLRSGFPPTGLSILRSKNDRGEEDEEQNIHPDDQVHLAPMRIGENGGNAEDEEDDSGSVIGQEEDGNRSRRNGFFSFRYACFLEEVSKVR